jgi:hypothetical protein
MKRTNLKNAVVAVSFLAAAGHAAISSAHTTVGALGAGAGATDHYQVICSTDSGGVTGRLGIRAIDKAPKAAPMVSVQTRKGAVATNSTDAVDGDAAYSPMSYNKGGNGVYYVTVTKSWGGAENYTLDYHCQTNSGVHTGTSIVQLQNQ